MDEMEKEGDGQLSPFLFLAVQGRIMGKGTD